MTAYYNEIDPFAAAWLRELIKAGHIAPGEVDERSIEDVKPSDVRGFTQCHWFAGIGVWSYALRAAGWPDSREVWTGSCPCQPFSTAGKRTGTADERHLWPALYHLAQQCKPTTLFGEQVASKDGLAWFETVQSDLESQGYTVGAVDLCAAGFGAPHIRQRLYFVGSLDNPADSRRPEAREYDGGPSLQSARFEQSGGIGNSSLEHTKSEQVGISRRSRQPRSTNGMGNPDNSGSQGRQQCGDGTDKRVAGPTGLVEQLGNPECCGRHDGRGLYRRCTQESGGIETSERGVLRNETQGASLTNGFWRDSDWIACRDGKHRPVEPGTFPLAHGSPNRVGRLRGYGNAIVAPVATAFIEAFLETENK